MNFETFSIGDWFALGTIYILNLIVFGMGTFLVWHVLTNPKLKVKK